MRIEIEGWETELDDWCSDRESSEDSVEYSYVSETESEGTWSDENDGSSGAGDGDEHDSRETKPEEDSTRPALRSLRVEELEESEEEEEFHDAQATLLRHTNGQ